MPSGTDFFFLSHLRFITHSQTKVSYACTYVRRSRIDHTHHAMYGISQGGCGISQGRRIDPALV